MRDRKGRRIDGSERRKEGKEDRPEDVVEMIVVGEDSWGGRGGMDTEGRKRGLVDRRKGGAAGRADQRHGAHWTGRGRGRRMEQAIGRGRCIGPRLVTWRERWHACTTLKEGWGGVSRRVGTEAKHYSGNTEGGTWHLIPPCR